MSKFIIHGGKPLRGVIRLGGAKNASSKLMIASLLAKGETRLLNFSRIGDTFLVKRAIEALGGKVRSYGKRTLFIDTSLLAKWKVPQEQAETSRVSTLFVGPLLHRFGRAAMPMPGGDKIGPRPLQRHFEGLEKFGAKVSYLNGYFEVVCPSPIGTEYRFAKNTHTGTETLIMVAVMAKGKTVLKNAAQEPEVDDLIKMLNKMGAKIIRKARTITIVGVKRLQSTIHSVLPDRNEAVTYACAALGTKGDVIIENAMAEDLQEFLEKVREIGGFYEIGDYGIRFFYKQRLNGIDVITKPHPGFMTDWQPLWTTLMTQAKGTSHIIETIFPNRFGFSKSLVKMGAKIELYNPKVNDPRRFYNFNLEDDRPEFFHALKVNGPSRLKGIKAGVDDLRAGATLTLAALFAKGETILTNISQIDRGYEGLDQHLLELGADIKRV